MCCGDEPILMTSYSEKKIKLNEAHYYYYYGKMFHFDIVQMNTLIFHLEMTFASRV